MSRSRSFHLGVVAKSLAARKGGLEAYFNRVLPALTERNVRVWAFSESFSPVLRNHPGVRCVEVPVLKLGQAIRKLTFNRNARRLTREYADEIDRLLTAGKTDFGDVYRAGAGVHEVFLERCLPAYQAWNPKHLVERRLQARLLEENTPEAIVANSKMVRDQLVDRFELEPSRIHVLYNPVETERFHIRLREEVRGTVRREYELPEEATVALFVGGDARRKGLYEAVRAAGGVKGSDLHLVVAGDVNERSVRRTAREHGMEENLVLAGYVDEVERLYGAADVLVLPSRYDPGANVVIEALAAGLPVITTPLNGTHELVEPGVNGLILSDPADVQALTDLLEDLVSGRVELSSRKAFETGRRHSLDRHVDSLMPILDPGTPERASADEPTVSPT